MTVDNSILKAMAECDQAREAVKQHLKAMPMTTLLATYYRAKEMAEDNETKNPIVSMIGGVSQ